MSDKFKLLKIRKLAGSIVHDIAQRALLNLLQPKNRSSTCEQFSYMCTDERKAAHHFWNKTVGPEEIGFIGRPADVGRNHGALCQGSLIPHGSVATLQCWHADTPLFVSQSLPVLLTIGHYLNFHHLGSDEPSRR